MCDGASTVCYENESLVIIDAGECLEPVYWCVMKTTDGPCAEGRPSEDPMSVETCMSCVCMLRLVSWFEVVVEDGCYLTLIPVEAPVSVCVYLGAGAHLEIKYLIRPECMGIWTDGMLTVIDTMCSSAEISAVEGPIDLVCAAT